MGYIAVTCWLAPNQFQQIGRNISRETNTSLSRFHFLPNEYSGSRQLDEVKYETLQYLASLIEGSQFMSHFLQDRSPPHRLTQQKGVRTQNKI